MYSSELQLKNISTFEASFLDLSIIVENKRFKSQFYDKAHFDSNISSNIYYVSMDSGISKFGRTTSDINAFLTRSAETRK